MQSYLCGYMYAVISMRMTRHSYQIELNLFSSDFIDGMCVVALAPAVIIIRGSTFHPLAAILSINGLYLLCFVSSVYGENLSFQYVNSMNCMVRLGSMSVGGSFWYGNPLTHSQV
jgi:hypothetical protein